MPILLLPQSPSAELSQGDLLKDVSLYTTDPSGQPSISGQSRHAIIISRDCAVAHDSHVVVAPVHKVKTGQLSLQKSATSKDIEQEIIRIKHHLANLRDGNTGIDSVYLGNLPGETDRYAASLNKLCTLELPSQEALAAWIASHRIASMAPSFLKALGVRLFWAFGRPGFDDIRWHPDVDLSLMVSTTGQLIDKLNEEIKKCEAEHQSLLETSPGNQAGLLALSNQKGKLENKIAESKAHHALLLAESQRGDRNHWHPLA